MRSRIIQPPYVGLADTPTITSYGAECVGDDVMAITTVDLSITLSYTANLLVFVPLILREPFRLSQFFWFNGTVVTGNVDVGVYSGDGTQKLVSTGSTAASGTSAIQVVDVTDYVLPANTRLWLAIGADGATRFVAMGPNATLELAFIGVKQQTAGWSSGLPSTITLSAPTLSVLPFFGFTKGVV